MAHKLSLLMSHFSGHSVVCSDLIRIKVRLRDYCLQSLEPTIVSKSLVEQEGYH